MAGTSVAIRGECATRTRCFAAGAMKSAAISARSSGRSRAARSFSGATNRRRDASLRASANTTVAGAARRPPCAPTNSSTGSRRISTWASGISTSICRHPTMPRRSSSSPARFGRAWSRSRGPAGAPPRRSDRYDDLAPRLLSLGVRDGRDALVQRVRPIDNRGNAASFYHLLQRQEILPPRLGHEEHEALLQEAPPDPPEKHPRQQPAVRAHDDELSRGRQHTQARPKWTVSGAVDDQLVT